MSTTTRRFGTDVSNIPADVLRKTPSKKFVSKSRSTPKSKRAPSSNKEPKSQLFDVMESLMETINIDDEISIKTSPVSKMYATFLDEFRYERQFLMSFKDRCVEPIEGLIPEVLPGYVPIMEFSNMKLTSTAVRNHSRTIDHDSTPSSEPISQAPSECSLVIPSPTVKECRTKQIRKQKPREEDPRRLAARQKQIDIGMNTVGYKKFLERPVKSPNDPKIPDIYQVCSKRSWDGQVRKWRRELHKFDPSSSDEAGLNDNDGEAALDDGSSDELDN